MVKTVGPLLSQAAHGKLAQNLIYSQRRGKNITRGFHMPSKEVSLGQWTQRHIIGLLTAHWQVMTTAEKAEWAAKAKSESPEIPGFAKFIKDANADLYTHHGLAGYWSMNELSGAQVLDYSGQGNHGTLKPTYPSDCPVRIDSFRKNYGRALSFDGSNDYVETPPVIPLNADFSIFFWVNANATPNTDDRVGIGTGPSLENRFYFYITTDFPTAVNQVRVWDAILTQIVVGNDIRGAGWKFLTLTRQGNVWRLYENSNVVAVQTVAGSIVSHSVMYIGGGIAADNRYHSGLIDEVRIYNRALGAAEIKKHYELLRLDKKRQPLLVH